MITETVNLSIDDYVAICIYFNIYICIYKQNKVKIECKSSAYSKLTNKKC